MAKSVLGFPTATVAKTFLDTVRNAYPGPGPQRIQEQQILRQAVEKHPDAARKVGPGIDYFFVDASPGGFSGRCFYLRRIDGTAIDISVKFLVKTESARVSDDLDKALRQAVIPQTHAYSALRVGHKCDDCTEIGTQVEHLKRFAEIKSAWLQTQQTPPTAVERGNGATAALMLSNPQQQADWVRFHQQEATYQWLCKACNQLREASYQAAYRSIPANAVI